jgi:hypothetical protein
MRIKFHLLVETEGAVAVGSSAVLGGCFVSLARLMPVNWPEKISERRKPRIKPSTKW